MDFSQKMFLLYKTYKNIEVIFILTNHIIINRIDCHPLPSLSASTPTSPHLESTYCDTITILFNSLGEKKNVGEEKKGKGRFSQKKKPGGEGKE